MIFTDVFEKFTVPLYISANGNVPEKSALFAYIERYFLAGLSDFNCKNNVIMYVPFGSVIVFHVICFAVAGVMLISSFTTAKQFVFKRNLRIMTYEHHSVALAGHYFYDGRPR